MGWDARVASAACTKGHRRGTRFRALAALHEERPCLVLLDLMPLMAGIDPRLAG